MFLSQLKPKTVADRGFRRRGLGGAVGGANPIGWGNAYYLARYFRKLNENKRNWIAGGRVLSAPSLLDSPIKNRALFLHHSSNSSDFERRVRLSRQSIQILHTLFYTLEFLISILYRQQYTTNENRQCTN